MAAHEKGSGRKLTDEEILRMAAAIHEQRRVASAGVHTLQQINYQGSVAHTPIPIYLKSGNTLASGNVPLAEHAAIAAEIYAPLLAQGLEEYRKRIEALTEIS